MSEPGIVETPLVESECKALRKFAHNLRGPDWAIGVLIDSALWNLERAEADRDRYREALSGIVAHADMPAGESWERAYVEVTSIARDAILSAEAGKR